MTPTETITILRQFNEWRRGEGEDLQMPKPREIGEAIDAAVEMIDRLAALPARMIDTKELRRLAQEAMHPVTKGRWMRLFGERTVYDRMEDGCRGIPVVSTPISPPHPFEAACLDFIAAANPAAVIELLDRLEAAESEAIEQARLNGMGSEREAALLAKLEAAEKSDAESLAMYRRARDERDELRAKIEAMEQQEPVFWWRPCSDGTYEGPLHNNSIERVRKQSGAWSPLYALPGAQGE